MAVHDKCECGHREDEHVCGDGSCSKCECPSFENKEIN